MSQDRTPQPAETLRVEIVLALPGRCWRREIEVPAGTSAVGAVRASGLDALCVQLSGSPPVIGIFGRKIGNDYLLVPGDRVELYRPLAIDPRARRRARASG